MRDRPNEKHRTALETKLGRKLKPGEVADHVDMDKDNNAPANLRPMERGEHSSRHSDPAAKVQAKLKKALTMTRRGEKLY